MADIDKEITVKVKAEDDTQKATQSAKARLRELQAQMLKLEEQGQKNTDAFRRMAAEAGSLKDAIGDTSAQVKVLASDTRTLDTFTSAIQGIAGGFAVAQGAAALFGEENEDVQKAMMKVQAALALVNGATALANTLNKDSALMVNLNAAAQRVYALAVGTSTGALKAFRIALVTTGLGALVVALGFAIDAMTRFGDKNKEAVDDQKDVQKALNETVGTLEFYERKLKAFGATDAQLAAIRKKTAEDNLAFIESNLKRLQAADAVDDKFVKQQQDKIEVLKVKIREEQNILDAAAADQAEKDKQARQREIDQRKRTGEQAAALQKQQNEEEAAKQKEIQDIITASRQALLENSLSVNERELEQIDQSYEERLAKVKDNEEAITLLLSQLRAEREAKIKEQADKAKQAQDEADKAALDAQKAQLDYQIALEDEFFAEKERLRKEDEEREKAYNEARVRFYNEASGSIVEIMRALGGKSKAVMLAALAIEKGMAIAQVVINLQKELAGINANAALNPTNALTAGATGLTQAATLSAMAKVNAGLRIAAIAATSIGQVRSITGGGAAGGAVGGGSTGAGGGMAAPQGNALNPSGQLLNPNTGQAINPQPLRAYVVESDVSGVQQRLRQIRQFAQLGTP